MDKCKAPFTFRVSRQRPITVNTASDSLFNILPMAGSIPLTQMHSILCSELSLRCGALHQVTDPILCGRSPLAIQTILKVNRRGFT